MARFQQTFASQSSFAKYGRKSKRELFLDQMNQVVPWSSELLALVEPVYPKAGNGRQPVGLGIMLRTYFLQQWFGLSDPGMEEAFYESAVLQRFAGVDLGVALLADSAGVRDGFHDAEPTLCHDPSLPLKRKAGAHCGFQMALVPADGTGKA